MIKRIFPNEWTRWILATVALTGLIACSEAPEIASTEASHPAGYSRINDPNENDPLNTHIYELDNGLQVYLTENHEEPRFYAEIAVRAGSKHDPADGTGLAHYLEHLLFKGNQNLGTLNYEAEKPFLDEIVDLYEQHFMETNEVRRAEIYSEINRAAQQAAEYSIPNEID